MPYPSEQLDYYVSQYQSSVLSHHGPVLTTIYFFLKKEELEPMKRVSTVDREADEYGLCRRYGVRYGIVGILAKYQRATSCTRLRDRPQIINDDVDNVTRLCRPNSQCFFLL